MYVHKTARVAAAFLFALLVCSLSHRTLAQTVQSPTKTPVSDEASIFRTSGSQLKIRYEAEKDTELKQQYKEILSARKLRNVGIGVSVFGSAGALYFAIASAIEGSKPCEGFGCWGRGMFEGIMSLSFSVVAGIGATLWTIGGVQNYKRCKRLDKALEKQRAQNSIQFVGIGPFVKKNQFYGLAASFSF